MNWDTSGTDSNLNQSLYGNLGQGEGIDLRIELNAILYGGMGKVPKGHWVILRKYKRAEFSNVYNKQTHEGIGGPAFEYVDELLKTRQVPLMKAREQLNSMKSGVDNEDTYVYYLEHTVNPKIGDDIFELSWSDHRLRPDILTVKPLRKFKIERVHPYRLEYGNIQYWMATGKYDEVKN